MLKLDIKKYDELYELVMRLAAITYLQGMVTDEEYIVYNPDGFEFILTYTRNFLYDEQRKTVLGIKKLISEESFAQRPNQ